METNYWEGDLVSIVRKNKWTLGYAIGSDPPEIRECPIRYGLDVPSRARTGNKFECIEGKMGLIVYVGRNRLDQTTNYRVLIEGQEMLCKSKVASKYFKLVETPNNESRRPSTLQDE